MNLQHLKNITEVERTGSVTKAAAKLFMGQPNLSKSIREVENEIGITVFRRSAKGVYPTPEGAVFLARARAVLEEMDRLEALYKSTDNVIRLAVCVPEESYAACAAAEFIRSLSDDEKIEMEMIPASLSRGAVNISEGICSIAAVRCPRTEEDYFRKLLSELKLNAEPLRTGKYMILFSEKSPLRSMANITSEALEGLVGVSSWGSVRSGGRMIVCGGDCLELLSRLPEGYMLSPALSENIGKKYGIIQREYSSGELYTEYLLAPLGYKPDEYTGRFINCLKNAINERSI